MVEATGPEKQILDKKEFESEQKVNTSEVIKASETQPQQDAQKIADGND